MTERLTTGLGVFAVAGMGVDYAANLYNGPTLTSYMQGRFTPAAAYRVNDRLTLGVTANLMVAQMKYDVAGPAGAGPGGARHRHLRRRRRDVRASSSLR